MKPIENHELSGLIDGELSPERTAEVRAAIEADPKLCGEFERLAALHADWSAAAAGAAFQPRAVRLPRPPMSLAAAVAAALAMLIVRFLPKFTSAAVGIGIELAALAAVTGLVLVGAQAMSSPRGFPHSQEVDSSA